MWLTFAGVEVVCHGGVGVPHAGVGARAAHRRDGVAAQLPHPAHAHTQLVVAVRRGGHLKIHGPQVQVRGGCESRFTRGWLQSWSSTRAVRSGLPLPFSSDFS